MATLSPKRGITTLEKLKHYSQLIDDGLTIDELKEVRVRIYHLKTSGSEEIGEKMLLLQCIKEFLEDSRG